MPYKSEDLWASGKPEPPLRTEVLNYLRSNDQLYFTSGEVAKEAFELGEFEEATEIVPDQAMDNALNERFRFDLKAELLLERLVEEGLVEKRSIRVSDSIDVAMDEHPDAFPRSEDGNPSDFGGKRTVYYRAADSD